MTCLEDINLLPKNDKVESSNSLILVPCLREIKSNAAVTSGQTCRDILITTKPVTTVYGMHSLQKKYFITTYSCSLLYFWSAGKYSLKNNNFCISQ